MQPKPSNDRSDDYDALLALLRTVCDEMYSLSCDIVSLGNALSGDHESGKTPQIRDIQSFDLIGQRAFAQAGLLQGIEQLLSGHADDWKARVEALIAVVPFYRERERLLAAFRRHDPGTHKTEPMGDDDIELF